MRLIGLILALGLILAPLAAEAQESKAGRTVTIGYLGTSSPSLEAAHVAAFREGLRQLGYVEGQNLIITYRWAEGEETRFAVLARELVGLKPAVILTAGTPAVLSVKQATTSIPIVTALVGDPVGSGLVSSLAKPGGNVTGFAPPHGGAGTEAVGDIEAGIPRVVTRGYPLESDQPVLCDSLETDAACG
jgi:putative ABC transport system substrate-binding protein